MSTMSYLNFDLQIEASGATYKARVVNSPGGEAEADFQQPLSGPDREQFLAQLGLLRQGQAEALTQLNDLAKTFGKRLFDAVFTGEILGCFQRSVECAKQKEQWLRIRLRLKGAPDLAGLPWEFLHNPSTNLFLTLSRKTPIVRYLDLPEPPSSLDVSLPANILVAISSPLNLPAIDAEQEWRNLKKAFLKLERKGLVRIDRLESATLAELQRKLHEREYNIFHFIGHGSFDHDKQEGVLLFEDEAGHSRPESGQRLGTVLHDCSSLRLVVLNACSGASASALNPFTGVAQSLVQQGMPAVIAMLFPVQDETALTFADDFYDFLTNDYPIEAALAETRKTIFTKGNGTEWGAPVLFMRAADGRLFNFQRAPASGTALAPAPPQRFIDTMRLEPIPPRRASRKRYLTLGALAGILLVVLGYLLRDFFFSSNLPAQKHLAVLPFNHLNTDSSTVAFCEGLREAITSELTRLQARGPKSLWVVSSSEVLGNNVTNAGEAKRKLGVNLAITGYVQAAGDQVQVTVNLVDAKSLVQLQSEQVRAEALEISLLQERIIAALAKMLNLEPPPATAPAAASHNNILRAREYYLQARGNLARIPPTLQSATSAIRLFELAVEEDSLYAEAFNGLCEAYWKKFELTQNTAMIARARFYCEHALSLDQSSAEPLVNLGKICIGTGEYQQALKHLNRALELDSANFEIHRFKAQVYEYMGMQSEAETAYRKAIALRPEYGKSYNELGVFYYNHGRYQEAAEQFRSVITLTPDNFTAYNNLGGIYSFDRRYDEARAMFDSSLALAPNHEAYSNLGMLEYQQGRFVEAAQRYEQALKLDSLDYVVWGNLASAYYWTSAAQEQARPAYLRAVALAQVRLLLNSNDAEVWADLSGYYIRIGETKKASTSASRALELAPDNVIVILTAALTYEELGNREHALQLLRKALEQGLALAEIEQEPGFNKLRDDSRFKKLIKRLQPHEV